MMVLDELKQSWYRQSVEMFGKDEAQKMWQHAKDPITGYVAKDLNCCHLLNGEIPCMRCGGFGMWTPGGGDGKAHVLCLKCFDGWGEVCSELLDKHGYVSSKKKWHAAFMEYCQTK